MPDSLPDLRQALLNRRLLAMGEKAPDPSAALEPDWFRANHTLKGQGYLGLFPSSNGRVASEVSIADSDKLRDPSGDVYPEDRGRESYPSLVPGMTAIELNRILNTGDVTPSLSDRATKFALARRAAGKSLYAQQGEQDYNYLPEFRRIK